MWRIGIRRSAVAKSRNVTAVAVSTTQQRTVFDLSVVDNGFDVPPPRHVMYRKYAPEGSLPPKEPRDMTLLPTHKRVQQFVDDVIANGSLARNLMLMGPDGSGKRTNLLLAGKALEDAGKRVAYITGNMVRAHSIHGIFMYHYFGLRVGDNLPILEQMVGMFRRHALLMGTSYENLLPSILNTDVLVFDSIHLADPTILKALDTVARELRGEEDPKNKDLPFGGLKVIGGGNFWKLETVSPVADHGGYLFQGQAYKDWFDDYYLSRIYHQTDPQLEAFTMKALLGELTVADCNKLEQLAVGDETQLKPTPYVDHVGCARVLYPQFAKQSARRVLPARLGYIRKSDFGSLLGSMIGGGLTFSSAFGLVDKLNLEPGTPVHTVFPFNNGAIPALEPGLVESTPTSQAADDKHQNNNNRAIVVNFPRLRLSVPIPPVRFAVSHRDHPEIKIHVQQYPLMSRVATTGVAILRSDYYYNVFLDGHYMTEVNELGNVLGKFRTFKDFRARNVIKFLKLEGMVHEAYRVHVRNLMQTGKADTNCTPKEEEWCRNCKTHIQPDAYYEHWMRCLRTVRWCAECNKCIPLSKMKAHREKHQIVMCVDCAQPIEWKNWETHRLTCGPMMREISVDNELLPERTRQFAMQFGLDRRDLHTVKPMTKAALPKDRGNKNRAKEARQKLLDSN